MDRITLAYPEIRCIGARWELTLYHDDPDPDAPVRPVIVELTETAMAELRFLLASTLDTLPASEF